MNLRLAIYELAAHYQLDATSSQQFLRLGGVGTEPANLARTLSRGTLILAALLSGLGVVFWIAANWETFGRTGRFALLQGLFVAALAGALLRPALRVALSLLAMLTIGALFAYFGQTYQTGADPWQLFALWAGLALPLCLSVRSDALWTVWTLVAMTGIALWIHSHTGHRWRVEPSDLRVFLAGWAIALLITVALSPLLARYTGAGPWSLRLGVTMSAALITVTGLAGLFGQSAAHIYYLALIMLVAAALLNLHDTMFDVFNLSTVSLGVNVLVFAGFAHFLFSGPNQQITAGLLVVLGLAAAGMLAGTVHVILRLTRAHTARGVQA